MTYVLVLRFNCSSTRKSHDQSHSAHSARLDNLYGDRSGHLRNFRSDNEDVRTEQSELIYPEEMNSNYIYKVLLVYMTK